MNKIILRVWGLSIHILKRKINDEDYAFSCVKRQSIVFNTNMSLRQRYNKYINVCIYHTIPAGSSESPVAAWLPLVLVLFLPKGAPVIAVSPCVLLPPWTPGTCRLFKARTPHLPPQRFLKTTLTPEERREIEKNSYQLSDTTEENKPKTLTTFLSLRYTSSQNLHLTTQIQIHTF